MVERGPTLGELLQRLAAREQLAAADLRGAGSWAERKAAATTTPWYLQPLIFAGALLAAGLITFGVVQILDLRGDISTELLVVGAVYLAAAVVAHVSQGGIFADHLGLALSIGGYFFVLIGVARVTEERQPEIFVLLAATALTMSLYRVYGDFLHRLLSCALLPAIARFALPAADQQNVLRALVATMVVVAIALLTRERQRPFWQPLAWACCFGLPWLLLPLDTRDSWLESPPLPHSWISSVVLALATLWTLHFATARLGVETAAAGRVLAVSLVAGSCLLGAPGILAAVFLIVLGYAAQHWPVAVAGLVALPTFVFKFYYDLALDLMAKSGVLVGSGALLLVARWAFVRGAVPAAAGGRDA